MLTEGFPVFSLEFNLQQLLFSACVAAAKMAPRTTSLCNYIVPVQPDHRLYVVYI